MSICNLSLQIIPLVSEEKIYPTVDKVIELIKDSGVKYVVGPMETTMEGELKELLKIVYQAQDICVQSGAGRILSMIKIDYSPVGVTMDEKVAKFN